MMPSILFAPPAAGLGRPADPISSSVEYNPVFLPPPPPPPLLRAHNCGPWSTPQKSLKGRGLPMAYTSKPMDRRRVWSRMLRPSKIKACGVSNHGTARKGT
jgi:hypothetical protein